jgi:ubiquinone/menaquinone biosynthesis C-methylase UbiE
MPKICLDINVEETSYESPTEWRMLGAQGKAEHIMTLCTRNGLAPATLLEVGAGDGAILRCLAENSFCKAMHAVEISKSGVEVILGQSIPGLISCQSFNGYELPFEDQSFDLVVLSHVLEHVEHERALLREIRRVSRYQLIEIPMDFPALENENFLMLGPSYGHINARSPASLRFLLSTEEFRVLDEMLGQYTLALQEYDYFVNNSRDKTAKAVARFRDQFEAENSAFQALPQAERERRASFYAVLTRQERKEERIARAMSAAKSYVSSSQIQPARLIFDYHVPKEYEIEGGLELARFCLGAGYRQAANEFVERVLKIDESNRPALEIRAELTASTSVGSAESSNLHDAAAYSSPLGTVKSWLKRNAPFLVRVARRFQALSR